MPSTPCEQDGSGLPGRAATMGKHFPQVSKMILWKGLPLKLYLGLIAVFRGELLPGIGIGIVLAVSETAVVCSRAGNWTR